MSIPRPLRLSVLAAAVLCASCAAPPGAGRHKELGLISGDGAVGLVFWAPEKLKGSVWVQFEPRDAQGMPTGVPISVHVESSAPALSAFQEPREGFRAFTMAFPLPEGEYVYSRWLAELDDGRTAVSAHVGWPFQVRDHQLVHLGHVSLAWRHPSPDKLAYQLTAIEAQPADSALLQRHLDVLRTFSPKAATFFARGGAASGVATIVRSSFRTIESSTSVYVK